MTLPPSKPRVNKLSYPPIPKIKGLVPFYAAGLGWHDYYPEFPFEKMDEAVYVDARHKGGLSFNLGLLEPLAYDALKGIGIGLGNAFRDTHIHIITKTKPWIAIWTY
jgi:hypothetical protein